MRLKKHLPPASPLLMNGFAVCKCVGFENLSNTFFLNSIERVWYSYSLTLAHNSQLIIWSKWRVTVSSTNRPNKREESGKSLWNEAIIQAFLFEHGSFYSTSWAAPAHTHTHTFVCFMPFGRLMPFTMANSSVFIKLSPKVKMQLFDYFFSNICLNPQSFEWRIH